MACARISAADVLCLEQNGHVAIEGPEARRACCRTATTTPGGSSSGQTLRSGHSCVDIPLIAESTEARDTAAKSPAVPPLEIYPALLFSAVPSAQSGGTSDFRQLLDGSLAGAAALESIRSVIILV